MGGGRMDNAHRDQAPEDRAPNFRSGGEGHEPSPALGRTCMKWGGDGELAPQDLQAILARLSAVDGEASGLMDCPVDPS